MSRLAMLACAAFLTWSTAASAQQTIFRVDHQSTSGGGSTYAVAYGVGLASSVDMTVDTSAGPGSDNGTNIWNWAHQTSGGYASRNFMRYDRWGAVDGDPGAGFYFNGSTVAPSGGWYAKSQASQLCLRFRVRWNAPLTLGANSSAQMKWFIYGGPGLTDGNDRMILSWYRATGPFSAGSNDNTEVSLTMMAGVSGDYTAVAISVGSWVHVQGCWRYTDAGSAYQRLYVNNNTEGSPTAENTTFTNSGPNWDAPNIVDTLRWGDIASTNSFSGADAQLDVMDFEVGDAFDASWAPSSDPVTIPARSFRIKGADLAALGLIPIFLWRQRR